MLDRWVIVYIDDILIYSNTLEELIRHVRSVLKCLMQYQLYAKAEKCEFHQTSTSFLGYVISQEGVAMDERKFKAVLEWPQPQTVKELQRFLGFAHFYRRFIWNFSSITAPLITMTKRQAARLIWSPESRQAFTELKTRFTSAPILRHPDESWRSTLRTCGVGALLSQRHGSPAKNPCAFFSRKLTAAERNYDVGNCELLAMKLALEEWLHWLEGATHPFLVLTDHKNLEYLGSAKRLNPRQARWSLFFTRFRFTVTYRPGTKNIKADTLSRQTEEEETVQPNSSDNIIPGKLLLAPVQWDIMTEIKHLNLQNPPPSECPANLTYLPESLRPRLLSQVHTTLSSGHPGITATENLLRNRFWWPTLLTDTTKYIQTCITCNTSKSLRQLPAGLLNALPTPRRPWSHIVIDFITDLPNSIGNTPILTIVDRFSKACRLIPLPKLPTSFETAELLCNHVFCFYGLPEDIVSDRGPQFTSRVWSAFFRNVNISLTSAIILNPMDKRSAWIRKWYDSSDLTVNDNNQTGAGICYGRNMLKILLWNPPQVWPLSRAFWASNLHCFPGLANPPNYLQSRTGYNRARRSGTGLIPIYFMPWDVKNNRPIDINTPTPNTPQANGSGCQPRICASDLNCLLIIAFLPHSMYPFWNPLVARVERRRWEPDHRPPCLSWLTARRRTECTSC